MGTTRKYLLREFALGLGLFGNPVFYIAAIIWLAEYDLLFAGKTAAIFIIIEGTSAIIKLIYKKNRPNPRKIENLIQKYDAGSFPSIHSARAAALAVIIVSLFPHNAIKDSTVILVALGVGYSRVYLKEHFISDVLIGFALGVVISLAGLLV